MTLPNLNPNLNPSFNPSRDSCPNPNQGKSGDGATVLHVAASENNLAVAELCIEQNAPLDARLNPTS